MLRHMTRRGWIAAVLAWIMPGLMALDAAADPVEISLEVSPEVGSEADVFIATVRYEVPGETGADRYVPPAFSDFLLVDQQAHRTLIEQDEPTGGHRFKTAAVYRYVLKPSRTGKLRIGGARVRAGGDEYESYAAMVDVHAASMSALANAPDPLAHPRDPTAQSGIGAPGFVPPSLERFGNGAPEAFLHVAVDRKTAYVGQQITITWLLYTRHEVLKFEPAVPRLDDVWSEILYDPSTYFRYEEDVVDGVTYRVAVASKRGLFATRPGTLVIGPFMARVASLYSLLGSDIEIASEPVEIDIEALPAGAPRDFDPSYVGMFTVEADVDRRRLQPGDSLTLTVLVRGHGAIRRTTPPVLDLPGFEFRAPRDFDEKLHPSSKVVSGERAYRYWATPQRGGLQTIPAVTLHFFDPRSGTYRQASSQPIEIEVMGDPASAGALEPVRMASRDIRLIRDGATISSRSPRAEVYESPWFWVASALPLLLFLGVVIVGRVRGGSTHDAMMRGLQRKEFRGAELHLRGARPGPFFAELARIVTLRIEERISAAIGSLTRDELALLLGQKGFARPTIERICRELDTYDFGRFAATAARSEDMQAALGRARELVREISATRTADHAGDRT